MGRGLGGKLREFVRGHINTSITTALGNYPLLYVLYTVHLIGA